MVVAYVDSVMSRLGRHLSIQAALQQRGTAQGGQSTWPQAGGNKLDPSHGHGQGPPAGSHHLCKVQAVGCHGQY